MTTFETMVQQYKDLCRADFGRGKLVAGKQRQVAREEIAERVQVDHASSAFWYADVWCDAQTAIDFDLDRKTLAQVEREFPWFWRRCIDEVDCILLNQEEMTD